MKKLGFRWVTALAAGILLTVAASCSKDTDPAPPSNLPVIADIPAAPAGTSGEIKFNAPSVWEISSDAMWLTFSPSTGQAGENKVQYTIDYKGQNFSTNQVANVTLVIAGQTVPFKLTRESKPRTITFTDASGTPGTAFEVKQDATNTNLYRTNFKVMANFDWQITAVPEWLTIIEDQLEGEAGKTYTVWATADPAKLEDIAMSGKLIFKDKNTPSAAINANEASITYIGADDSFIVVNGFETFKVEFTKEGMLKSDNTLDAKAFSILAKPGYAMYFIKNDPKWGATLVEGAPDKWVGADKVQSPRALVPTNHYEMWAQENKSLARELLLYVIPKSVVTAMNGDPYTNFFNMEGDFASVKNEYEKFYSVKISQDGVGAGFMLGNIWGQGGEGATLTKVENPDPSYGTDVVYELEVENETTDNSIGLSAFDDENMQFMIEFAPADKEKEVVSGYETSLMGQYGNTLQLTWARNSTPEDKTITIKCFQKSETEDPTIFGILLVTRKGKTN